MILQVLNDKKKHTFLAAALSVAACSERASLALVFLRRDSGGKISCLVGTVLNKILVCIHKKSNKIQSEPAAHQSTS